MPILVAQNLTTEEVHLGDLYTKVPKPGRRPDGSYEPGTITTFRSSSELMRSPALHKAVAEGRLAIAIQFTDDEIASGFDPWPGLTAGSGGSGNLSEAVITEAGELVYIGDGDIVTRS